MISCKFRTSTVSDASEFGIKTISQTIINFNHPDLFICIYKFWMERLFNNH